MEQQIQVVCRFKGEIAEAIKKMAEEDDRSFAYIVQRLVKERLEQLEAAG